MRGERETHELRTPNAAERPTLDSSHPAKATRKECRAWTIIGTTTPTGPGNLPASRTVTRLLQRLWTFPHGLRVVGPIPLAGECTVRRGIYRAG